MTRLLLLAAFATLLCACASSIRTPGAATANAIDLERAADSIVGSTKAEVNGALGQASVVRFDSGYEIWLYRFVEISTPAASAKSPREGAVQEEAPASELVLLFTPSGTVAKVRIRHARAGPS